MQPVVADDLVRRFRPRGSAITILECRDSEILISGPLGTGKSRAVLEKLHHAALKYPGMRGLIVRKTLASLGASILEEWRTNVIAEAMADKTVRYYGGSREKAAQYTYDNGSVIFIGGLDNATKVLSAQYDLIYAAEATDMLHSDWMTLSGRCRNGVMPYQQLIGDCNPGAPTHWLKKLADAGKIRILYSKHEENPRLYNSDGTLTPFGVGYMKRLDNFTGVAHTRNRLGEWVAAEGQVYDGYKESIHVIDKRDIPYDWTRYWSVDFGFTNPFVCQMWAEDDDGRLWMYREFYETERLVEDHARDILASVTDAEGTWTEPKPRAIICDHDAEDRATLERHLGISTSKAHKTKSDGIQAVQARLRVVGDGKPRLMLLRDSLVKRDMKLENIQKPTSTIGEITGYVWDRVEGKAAKEEPIKMNDHGMDAMRYMVAELDLGGRPSLRFL